MKNYDNSFRAAAALIGMPWSEVETVFGKTSEDRAELWPAFRTWLYSKGPLSEERVAASRRNMRREAVASTRIKYNTKGPHYYE